MSATGRASLVAVSILAAAAAWLCIVGGSARAASPAAGPPYPSPSAGQYVYDFAGVFSRQAVQQSEATIQAIEARTGAQVVVLTQVKPQSDTPARAEADARALMDQWGVGRRGFDDGLVILFDLDRSLRHGQVQLFAGSGFRATFLGDGERQAIFQEDMLPALQRGDMDGALLAALDRVDAAATPAHAQALTTARQLNAVIGVAGILLAALFVAYWAFHWLRYGRDPVYVDDPSVLMPAPPPGCTAALAALVHDGRSTRHALTTALVDLASRGDIRFQREDDARVGVSLMDPSRDDTAPALERRPPLGRPERTLLQALRELAGERGGYIEPDELVELGGKERVYSSELEQAALTAGWFAAEPSTVVRDWALRGVAECVIAVGVLVSGLALPSSGATLAGGALLVAGIVTTMGAWAMPARTLSGSMLRAMLAAYRRTLQKLLEQARSMQHVVDSRTLPWIETPDQALVWGVALGLQRDVETVLRRSLEDARSGAATGAWFPGWYVAQAGTTSLDTGPSAAASGVAPGLLASSALPDVGGMFAAIGSIGAAPPSGGAGGFGGGGSAGGGGAGGGF